VNVSKAQISGSNLAAAVVNALASSRLPPERLELEITESVFLSGDEKQMDSLDRLRSLGVRLVLEDFGMGYSSFRQLSPPRFQSIKINKSFVHALSSGDKQARAIVQAIIALGHGMQVAVTAEGVETKGQAELMTELGCNFLQGFYFGRPAALTALPQLDYSRVSERKRA
jgi:EAL domain-containing protein (putative c-di-GMP-specific phosphodiesterase class I)